MTINTLIEIVGAITVFMSTIYARKEHVITWFWAAAGSILYFIVYWEAELYASAEIQVLYLTLSIYGLIIWMRGKSKDKSKALKIIGVTSAQLIWTSSLILVLTSLLSQINNSSNNWMIVYTDAALVSLAIVAQGLMAKKYFLCWYLWLIVNIGYLPLFAVQQLWVSFLLYVFLFYFTFNGFLTWRNKLNEKNESTYSYLS
ncbi:MAG: nicotinamide riboside transporter PnuC [Bacteroidota bacterium]